MNAHDLQLQPFVSVKQTALKNRRLSQLRDSLINRNKTKTETEKSQFPNIKSAQRSQSNKKAQKMISIQNRHLRYLYHQFCKQSYIGGAHATFDDISQSAQNMTLNKWMVFCREFSITDKLTNRDLTLIFKTATKQKTLMNLQQFCIALEIVKERMRINPQTFASDILHVDSHASARNRLCVMKINFSGPKTNFFIQSQLTQKQREEQKSVKKFKQKQRQYVLHQGMFKQHIQLSLLQRKNERRQKKQKQRNSSAFYKPHTSNNPQNKSISTTQRYRNEPLIKVNSPSRTSKTKSIFGNYSKIFKIKRTSNTDKDSTQNGSSYLIKNVRREKQEQLDLQGGQSQSKSRLAFEERRVTNGSQVIRDEESQYLKNYALEEKWEINSDESDEILKTHFENEKKMKNSSIVKDQKDIYKHKQDSNEDVDNDMMITRYN